MACALDEDGRHTIQDILSLSGDDINALTWSKPLTSGSVQQTPLNGGARGLLHALLGFVFHRASKGMPIHEDEWAHVEQQEFEDYRISPDFLVYRTNPVPVPHHTTIPKVRDPVQDFKRGIKRDITQFTILKDDKQWDSWNRSTIAQARAQDVDVILDTTYTPIVPDDKALFQEKQKFMYAVFEKCLLTDTGKSLVRQYAATFDAQAIYAKLSAYALSSTQAKLRSTALLTYITSTRLGGNNWTGTTHSFILHWQDQIRRYEDLIPSNGHFTDDQKRTMLENAVHKVAELRAVKNQADQMQVHTGKPLTYPQYCTLLLSAAAQYDSQFAACHT